MAINLVVLLKENNLIEANQLLATSILHLEGLELEIDKQPNLGIIYTFINEKISNFADLMTNFNEILVDPKQPQKLGFLVRLANSYEFYSILLKAAEKNEESNFALEQAEALKKEIA